MLEAKESLFSKMRRLKGNAKRKFVQHFQGKEKVDVLFTINAWYVGAASQVLSNCSNWQSVEATKVDHIAKRILFTGSVKEVPSKGLV